ncbi:peptidase C39 family protein [Micromonospora sp. STR1_7]|uniref:Peptidase C39 family protein n=1 Tax=Micromonospora parastrephiae TaxID=2806101 RepID=A0ABS1XXS9_9ACTN|nr:peptidase C39 family protein [Micromonospora parastrephiae]MBM0234085.1 peptidase C39 family protein [Micromonospora parastrephiae]
MTIAAPPTRRDIAYRGFHLPADSTAGTVDGLHATDRGLALDDADQRGRWTTPPVRVGFGVGEVVPSWTAETPNGCWIEVELRGWHGDAPSTDWYLLARWAADDSAVRRASVPGQHDGDARVNTDTLLVTGATVTGWQARVTLCRPADSPTGPVLRSIGAVAAGPTPTHQGYEQEPAVAAARGRVLDVPRYSQRLHAGQHPQWGGGGDSWCSPTCISMVLAYWGADPPPERYAWVEPPGPRPVVVHAARHCYDHAYAGAGNWPFNTAYAGLHGVDAFVTRLRSLVEAEAFVAAGIPLIVSAAFRADEVPGLAYDSRGHLMVLVGFTADGDPVLNDPYAPDDDSVRRTVPRQRFEAAWQRGSGGMAYVLRPSSVPLPLPPAQANW